MDQEDSDDQEDTGEGAPIDELTDPQLFNNIKSYSRDIASARNRPVLNLLYPVFGTVGPSDALTVYREFLYHKDIEDLDIILHSGGGDIHEAYDIIKLCRKHTDGDVTVFVPVRAMSAATLIALGADKVVLTDIGKLGPLDPQIQHPETDEYMPVRSITDIPEVLEESLVPNTGLDPEVKGKAIIRPIAEQVDPYHLTVHQKTTDLAREYGQKILTDRGFSEAKAKRCIDYLVEYPTHTYSVDLIEIDENTSLNSVIDASGLDNLDQGTQIEFALTYLISFYQAWDQQYINMEEPRMDPRIELIFPPEPEQVALDDIDDLEDEDIDLEQLEEEIEDGLPDELEEALEEDDVVEEMGDEDEEEDAEEQ